MSHFFLLQTHISASQIVKNPDFWIFSKIANQGFQNHRKKHCPQAQQNSWKEKHADSLPRRPAQQHSPTHSQIFEWHLRIWLCIHLRALTRHNGIVWTCLIGCGLVACSTHDRCTAIWPQTVRVSTRHNDMHRQLFLRGRSDVCKPFCL